MSDKYGLSCPILTCRAGAPIFAVLGFMSGVIVTLLSAGCVTPPGTMSSSVRFAPTSLTSTNRQVQALHVNKAQEGRPDGGRSSLGMGFLTFIPLVPYGPQRFTPERYFANAAMFNYDFKEDLAQTVVKDLMASGLAQSVSYDPFASPQSFGDVNRLELTLKEGVWHRNFTLYGCSVFGVYLWLVGLPVSYGHANLAYEAVVYAPNGAELGRRSFEAELPLTESAYASPHQYPRRLPLLYEKMSPDFRSFVSDCLSRSPVALPKPVVTEAKTPVSDTSSLTEKMAEIKALKESGVITEAEYQAKRKKIIDGL